jgi:hypothetical protein
MPDFNADKEHGHGTMKWVVRNAHKGLPVKVLHTGKGDLKLDKQGRCVINDAALAAEIRKDHAKDMAVSRVFTEHPADRGHHYFFTIPELPWKRSIQDMEPQEVGSADRSDETAEDEQYAGEGTA